ncbi:response regulator [Streptomyces sp. NPDC059985]|uniref:response regulator n=1 Tax=Streptomyces sp. NPDC059985 TaxID=3347025 RepID=UPI0036AD9568
MTQQETRLRVIVADDHPVYRQGVVRTLTADPRLHVLGDFQDGREALDAIRSLRPDVALLDNRMPGLDGIRVTTAVRREELPTLVLMLSAFTESASVYKALQDGVTGYLTKEAEPHEIIDAVLACSRGESVLPQELTSGLVDEIRQRSEVARPQLTEREFEVLRMIADGKSIPEMAKEVFLAPTTLKSHVQRIYEKLGVSTRGAVVAEAMRRGLLE